MKLENTIKLLGMFALSTFLLAACDPDDLGFKDVSTSGIDSVYNALSGTTAPYGTIAYQYQAMYRAGSTYDWNVTGFGATVTPDPEYPFIANITFNETSENIEDVTVSVTETTSWGLTTTYEVEDITVQAYCPYPTENVDGVLEGTDVTLGDDGYESEAEFTYVDDRTIKVTGLGVGWMTDFWGEVIVTMNDVTIQVDEYGLNVTIPEQQYMTTTYNGAAQDPYSISGTGVIDGCTGMLTLSYELDNAQPWGAWTYANGYSDDPHFTARLTLPD